MSVPLLELPSCAGLARRRLERCDTDPCRLCEARAFSLCNAVEEENLKRLAEAATVLALPAGQTLVTEGQESAHLFNVTAGAVKVYKLLGDGRRQIVGFLFVGDFLGLPIRDRYPFGAETLTPVRVCRFQRRRFEELLAASPGMEKRLFGMASNELEAAQNQMLLLERKTATERIATFLVDLAHRARRLGGAEDRVVLPMSRTDIADYVGLTTETVSRLFTRLRTQGLIRLEGSSEVRLVRFAELEALAEAA